MKIRRIQPLIVLVGLALLANAAMAADTIKKIVSPADFANKEGEGATPIFTGGIGTDAHFQQFYLADDFVTSLPTGGYIKEIRFRTDSNGGGALAGVLAHVEVSMSYAPGFGFISKTFAQNKGAQYMQVYSGSLDLPESHTGQYDMTIVLQNQFYYDPRIGNLMLDYVNFGNGGFATALMDRTGNSPHTATVDGSRFATIANSRTSGGLITQFTVDAVPAVPEPSVIALMGLAATFVVVYRRTAK